MTLTDTLFHLDNRPFSLLEALFLLAGFFLFILLVYVWRSNAQQAMQENVAITQKAEMDARMADIMKAQAEMAGRMQTFAEVFGSRQQDLTKALSERMDTMSHRMGQNLTESTKSTHENLKALGERLAIIDKAQTNITALSSQVVELQNVLANKQTRGAFGQGRMETIVKDGLPIGAYGFQETLSNNKKPDCLIFMPNEAPSLVIDAKFPLEAWNAVRHGKNPQEITQAKSQFRRDIDKHIKDIAEKYLIHGETQDTAFMFVPSESIFSDIHEHYEDIIQKAHRARVVIVSPSLLMLSIQVVQSVLRDQKMREQAHIIQKEVILLMEDVTRLDKRVENLQKHFSQASGDIKDIQISSGKITRRGQKIEEIDFDTPSDTMADDSLNNTSKDLLL